MARRKKGPPSEPPTVASSGKVASIVGELERRSWARLREKVLAKHVRELETAVESIDMTRGLEEADFDAAFAEVEAAGDDPSVPEVRAQLRCARALRSCLRGDVDAGFSEWAAVHAEHPGLALPLVMRARWRMKTDARAALADLDRAATIAPNDSSVYFARGECHLALGDGDRALANYRRALALDPASIDGQHAVAKLLLDRGEDVEALATYNRLIAQASGYVDFYEGRAQLLERGGDHLAAIRDYDRMLALDPANGHAYAMRARVRLALGDRTQALADYERATALAPAVEAYATEQLALRMPDLPHDAIAREIVRLYELFPSSALLAEARAHQLAAEGDHEKAIAAWDAAIAGAPEDADSYMGRAKSHAVLGDAKNAYDDACRAIERAPDRAQAYTARAIYRTHLDADDAAVTADFDRAVELAPSDVSARYHRGCYLSGQERHEEALADFDRAIALAPGIGAIYYERSLCREALGDDEGAEEDRDRALDLGFEPDEDEAEEDGEAEDEEEVDDDEDAEDDRGEDDVDD